MADALNYKCQTKLACTQQKRLSFLVSLQLVCSVWLAPHPYSYTSIAVYLSLALCMLLVYFFPDFRSKKFDCLALKKLFTFPFFWFGLGFILYIALGAFNPSWVYKKNATYWWLESIPYVEWLPTSVKVPLSLFNPFKVIAVWAAAWVAFCCVCLKVTSRKWILSVFWVFVLNGVVFALLAIWQKTMHVGKILGVYETGTNSFFGTFIYQNHGGVYVYLVLAVVLTLFLFYLEQSFKGRKKGLCLLLFLMALEALCALTYNASRGVWLILSILLVVFLVQLFQLLGKYYGLKRAISLIFIFLFIIFFSEAFLFEKGHYQMLEKKLAKTRYEVLDTKHNFRILLIKATWEMFKDKPVLGWGGASFRYYFPVYKERYPLLKFNGPLKKPLHFNYAHTDWLQMFAEYGLLGSSFVIAAFLYWLTTLLKLSVFLFRHLLFLFLSSLLVIVYAAFDFILQNPSILITLFVVVAAVYSWQKEVVKSILE